MNGNPMVEMLIGAKGNALPLLVTPDNFSRAETHMYFSSVIKLAGSIGRFGHRRELTPIDKQHVVRPNRDTLYSAAVFDLDAGPVTVTMPEAGDRFMTMIVINEEHHVVDVVYGAGAYTMTTREVGTRYVMAGIRTFVDPGDTKDIQQACALQDAIDVDQPDRGDFQIPDWDQTSQKTVREALRKLGATVPDTKGMFGAKGQVDPVRHLIGTATAWGGNPEWDATYLTVTPSQNDGETSYGLAVKDVPVDAFWSISVYNADGYFEHNSRGAYTVNSVTAKRESDGSVVVRFGGCDGSEPNCLPIMRGWNYMVRLFRPRPEILNGDWVFPAAEPLP
jgi:hypothetical protein